MPILSCVEPNCEADVSNKKRSLCKTHYQQWYYRERRGQGVQRPVVLVEIPPFTCAHCGLSHAATTANARRKQTARKFCNRTCNSAYEANLRKIDRLAAKRENPRFCPQCNADITERKADAKFCSVFCSEVYRGARFPKPLDSIECALDGCDVVFTPNRRATKCCSEKHGQIHWNRVSRADGRQKAEPWNDRRKSHWHKRRAQKMQLPADNIRPTGVYERDEWVCNICSAPVDRNLSWPDPMSPSLDHVLPLSLGGHHTMENVALAHLSCNVRKGNRVEADAMSA